MDGLWRKTPIKMDDLGGKPTISGNMHVWLEKKNNELAEKINCTSKKKQNTMETQKICEPSPKYLK